VVIEHASTGAKVSLVGISRFSGGLAGDHEYLGLCNVVLGYEKAILPHLPSPFKLLKSQTSGHGGFAPLDPPFSHPRGLWVCRRFGSHSWRVR
jgi:hypothetical protein